MMSMEKQLLERFLRYVEIDTTSDRHASAIPSTDGQWELLHLLEEELRALGLEDVTLDESGFLIARLPATMPEQEAPPVIGFLAHVDTTAEAPGAHVKPRLHEHYDGSPIELDHGVVLDPHEFPELKQFVGETIITSDGTTLLGSDDKAGVAEIMSAVAWLQEHQDVGHGPIEIIFTPDEETGNGMKHFPREKLQSVYCYTMDGDGEGSIEAECFYGYKARLTFEGVATHPGKGRGKLVNAVTMAGAFLAALPRNESAEATDDRYGFYYPLEVNGSTSKTTVDILLRDFDHDEVERRVDALEAITGSIKAVFPGGDVALEVEKQYANMYAYVSQDIRGVDLLEDAIRKVGAQPERKIIRGGTDGARLSEMGIPTPNVFNGGNNFHSVREWAVLSSMVKASQTIVELVKNWSKKEK